MISGLILLLGWAVLV